LSAATSQLDLWIAGASLDQESVALYGSAKRLMRIVSLPLVMMNLVVPPLIAELHAKGDTTRLERAVRGAASLAGIPALVTLVAFVLWREELLGILYGDFYRQAGTILFFLTIERLAFVWSGPCALALTMTGHDAVMLRMTTIGSILAAVGAATGAALDGGRGIAIGVALAGIIRHSLMWWATRRECQIRTDIDFSSIPGGYEIVKRMLQRRMGR
jgi:O-antigen/teichoic acid export membrane protein